MMQNKNLMLIVGVIVIIAIVGGFFAMNKTKTANVELNNNMTMTPTSPAASQKPSQSPTASSSPSDLQTSGVKIISVEAGSFYYKPNEIRIKKGEKVKIEMKSTDMMHDLNIDALEIKIPITKLGDTGTVEFTADKTGTFEMYCSVGNHKQMGQVGKLIVE